MFFGSFSRAAFHGVSRGRHRGLRRGEAFGAARAPPADQRYVRAGGGSGWKENRGRIEVGGHLRYLRGSGSSDGEDDQI